MMINIIEIANYSCDWNSLEREQQVKVAFLISRNVPTFADDDQIREVLNPNTQTGKKLYVFVRKGGDIVMRSNSVDADDAMEIFHKMINFKWTVPGTTPTLLNGEEGFIKPLHRYQDPTSTVCYLVDVANAIFYSKVAQSPTHENAAINLYAFNIGRFMRNNFSG